MTENSTSSISKGTMFPPQLAAEIFNKVKGHSSLVLVVVYANCDMYSPVYMGS